MLMSGVVLVLTQRYDLTADAVIHELHRRGLEVVRFDPGDFPLRAKVCARIGGAQTRWSGELLTEGRRVDLRSIHSIWYRRPSNFRFRSDLADRELEFARGEARGGLGGALRSLDCLWVNHPDRQVIAAYKPVQLQAAVDVGFDIPSTVVTNSPHVAREFFEAHQGQIIYKALSRTMVPQPTGGYRMLFTNKVSSRELEGVDRVRHTACMFQEYIPKRAELRVTVIGEQVLAVEMQTAAGHTPQVDFRRQYRDLTYSIHDLPADIADRCRRVVAELGLCFGALDIVLGPEGRYVFLEVNASGQWLWLERETGLPLCETIVDLLTRDARTLQGSQ